MRALAEFIIRGRLHAGMFAILGMIIPLLTPVTVALVTLRKGAFEGAIILLIGLCPALFVLASGEGNSSAIAWVNPLLFIVVYFAALALRETISLAVAIISIVVATVLITGIVEWLLPQSVDHLLASLEAFTLQMASQQEGGDAAVVTYSRVDILGFIAYGLAFYGLVCLLFSRWLQALAFNPGGFGDEFRGLKLGYAASAFFLIASVALRYQGGPYFLWANLLSIPVLLVFFSIVHNIAKQRKISTPWLVLAYFVGIQFMPIAVCIGCVDAWVNFRDRFAKKDGHTD